MVIIPLVIGITFRHFLGDRIKNILKLFPAISATFIIFICALVIALNKGRIADITFIVIVTVVILNLNGMLMGYGIGKLAKFSIRRRRTLSIEIGMQNAGLGTVLALKHFGPQSAIPRIASS